MYSQLPELWDKALTIVKENLNSTLYDTWIVPIIPVTIEDNTIILSVPNPINKTMVEGRYLSMLRDAVYEVSGRYFNISVSSDDELTRDINLQSKGTVKSQEPAAQPQTFSNYSPLNNSMNLNPKYTFENYIVGNSNRFAHAASLAVAQAPAMAYNPLFLWGGVGLGKTHLMQAIGSYILNNNPSLKVLLVTAETFTNEMINSIKDNKNEEFRNKYRSIDVLLIDDIQFIAGKVSTEEEFFHTFNALHQSSKQIVLTSDRPPKEIPNLAERLRSRFEWGLICDINPPDYETRIAILKKKAQDEGIEVSDKVLMYIAEKVKSNIRELEGIFNTVIAYRGLVNKDISIEVAAEALKNYHINKAPKVVTPDMVIEATSKYFRIRPEDIKSQRRTKELVTARQIAMYLCRNLTSESLMKMGDSFGDRDHTTIMYGIKKIETEMKTNPDIQNAIDTLTRDIKGD